MAHTLSIPVLGSGDVVDQASAGARLRSGVAGLFIGRGALQNPYIFSDMVEGRPNRLRHNPQLCLTVLSRYSELLTECFSPNACVGKLKQLASQMCRGHGWRKLLLEARRFDDQRALLVRLTEAVAEQRTVDDYAIGCH